jgi:hypothetical protein
VLKTKLHQVLLDLKSLPWDKSVRYTLSLGVPLVICTAIGSIPNGIVAMLGSLYVVNIANVDARSQERLVATLAGSLLITSCAQLGSLLYHSPLLTALGLLTIGTAAGWLHSTHMAIEIMVRFAVLGFLFGAVQLAAFGAELIEINEKVLAIFLCGGLWTTIILAIEHWLFHTDRVTLEPGLAEGWRRIRANRTAGLRFAICYGTTATIAFGGSFLFHLPRPFWVTATTLIVMKPDSRATVRRTVERFVGTLIGLLLVAAIVTSTVNPNLLIVCMLLAMPLIPIGLVKNYTLCCTAVTVLTMVTVDILSLDRGGDRDLLIVRFYSTLIGCALIAIGTAITYPELWLPKPAKEP